VVAGASRFFPSHRDDVRYVYKHGQLHNRLAPALPKIIGEMAPPFVVSMLEAQGLSVSDISHWAIHAGGEKILAEVQKGLGLTDAHLAVSRQVLECFGNMSSPTVLFELERILDNGIEPGRLLLRRGVRGGPFVIWPAAEGLRFFSKILIGWSGIFSAPGNPQGIPYGA